MRIIDIRIFDFEVYSHDWIVVFKSPVPGSKFTVIHNDSYKLQKYILKNYVLGGFNNKFYDNWILQVILNGGDNAKVKEMNDYIIKKRHHGWTFPFLQYKPKEFRSFDLRDDLDERLSLKAIEGNIGANIVETSVSFDIDRPLTPEELERSIQYCKTDVDNQIKLYHSRRDYIDSKKTVARLKDMDEVEAIGLTNAKLTAKFLDAKMRNYDDEMEYEPPKELQIGRYAHTLEFFMNPVDYTVKTFQERLKNETRKITIKSLERRLNELMESQDRYSCELETEIAGVFHKYAWGGIHGAIPNYIQKKVPGYKIVTIDVASYYPSMMLEYQYISRSIPSVEGYAAIYKMRMKAKREGDHEVADALKLILNTCYGAMKNRYNELYDPRNASAICITGQLLLTDLIDKLEDISGFELIQSNTDGIIIRFPVKAYTDIVYAVAEWEKRTRMNMEYTEIHAIAQKDVNNYVMKSGETFTFKAAPGGGFTREVTKPDKGKLKSKGGYVSLSGGGDFKNNSLVVLHKALVEYFMNDVPIEDTINSDNNVQDFQMIAKTGSTYQGTYHEFKGEKVPVQKVNRVYATRDHNFGCIYKIKSNGRADKIASLPDHCVIDNQGALEIRHIDKDFYIDLAYKRVQDYTGKNNKKSEEQRMATTRKPPVAEKEVKAAKEEVKVTKTEEKETVTPDNVTKLEVKGTVKAQEIDPSTLNVYQKISKVRLDFLAANIQKSGINHFAEFEYFELADIVPVATVLSDAYGLLTLIDFDTEYAYMHVIDTNVRNDSSMVHRVTFRSPRASLDFSKIKGMNALQALGGEETYQRRYLYMMYLDIVEQDPVDTTAGKDADEKEAPKTQAVKSNRPASAAKRDEVKKELIDENGEATETQIKSIKTGLKKLRAKNDTYEVYITSIAKKIKAGLPKKEAENVLIEIGKKIEE